MPSVKKSYAENFELAKKPIKFLTAMDAEILRVKPKIIRIHASGDFFNKNYFMAWVNLASMHPEVKFYAYSKMVLMIKTIKQEFLQAGQNFPKNFTVIFSEGGKQDAMISENNDRHSRVFSSIEELKAAGYADVTSHDLGAMGPNHKIGLVYHGAKSKQWSTNKEGK